MNQHIEKIILSFPGYTYRRVTHALARDGWSVNQVRVMREEGFRCCVERVLVPTSEAQHGCRQYRNRIEDPVIDQPEHV